MQTVTYYLALPFIYGISLLPKPLLYLFSSMISFLLRDIIGYRKGIVTTNLKNAFPEKSNAEIRQIRRRFYVFMCDLFLETIKTLTISSEGLKKYVAFEDLSLCEGFVEKNQSLLIVMGHFGNWELGAARFNTEDVHTLHAIYRPLSNPRFDRLLLRMRNRHGTKMYKMKGALRSMIRDRHLLTATAFVADQTPSYQTKNAQWLQFLNQETLVFYGPEKIARTLKYPMVYMRVRPLRRGKYLIQTELLEENLDTVEEGTVMQRFFQKLEEDIRRQPAYWLWSHKRWKHKRPPAQHEQSHN